MWRERVTLPFKYDFDFVLERMEEDPLIHLDREEKWVDIPVSEGDLMDVVRVTSIGTTDEPAFVVEGEKEKDDLLERVSDIFLWERNMNEVEEHFKKTSLAELQRKFPATPVVKSFHPYDALMRVIIHQQLNKSFAYTLSTRFVQEYGFKWRGVWFYPSPETVASLSYEDLRKLQFSGRKAEYVIDTSRKMVKGEVDLHSFYTLTDEETKNSLTKIRGIGKWTAQNWLMTGLGRPDLFPEADVGIQNAWKKYFDLDNKPDRSEMLPESEQWAPYRSYAALLLWRSLMEKN